MAKDSESNELEWIDRAHEVWHFTVVAGQHESGEWYFVVPDEWGDSPATIECIGDRPAKDGDKWEITWRDVERGAEEERFHALWKAVWFKVNELNHGAAVIP